MERDSNVKFYGKIDCHSQADRGPRSNKGGLHSYIPQQGEDELNLGALDGILDEIDEVEGDAAAQSLAATCKDYLLDLDFTKEISALNYHPHNKVRVGNSSLDSHSPRCSGSSNGAVVMSESSAGTYSEHNDRDGTCAETFSCGMYIDCKKQTGLAQHGEGMYMDCKKQTGHTQHGEVNNCLRSSDIRKPNDFCNMTTSITEPSYGRNNSAVARVDDLALGWKRQRKPTRRYIEESTETKPSRDIQAGEKLVPAALEEHRPQDRPPSRMGDVAFSMSVSLPLEDSWEEGNLNALSLTGLRKERPKKHEICMEDEVEETYSDESEDEIVKKKLKKRGDRRKHQKIWTLPEATKLVDGISEFGVGRWTQIKRLSFAASAHRTPIDLRDKWRNLLRASYVQKPNQWMTEEEEEKHSRRLLPNSLLCRVRELASVHPYPRKDPSRSPSLSVGKNCAGGRNLRRRREATLD